MCRWGFLCWRRCRLRRALRPPVPCSAADVAVEPRPQAVRSKLRHPQVRLAAHMQYEYVPPRRCLHFFSCEQHFTLL
jgi:hypothetical protein